MANVVVVVTVAVVYTESRDEKLLFSGTLSFTYIIYSSTGNPIKLSKSRRKIAK